jgi:hypothetical protein
MGEFVNCLHNLFENLNKLEVEVEGSQRKSNHLQKFQSIFSKITRILSSLPNGDNKYPIFDSKRIEHF